MNTNIKQTRTNASAKSETGVVQIWPISSRLIFLASLLFFRALAHGAQPEGDARATPLLVLNREGQIDHRFTVSVNGTDEIVHNTAQGFFCQIELERPVVVEVGYDEEIKTVDVRPRSRNIKSDYSGRKIRLTLNAPAKMSLEVNGNLKTPLFLFADLPETQTVDPKNPAIRYFKKGQRYDVGNIKLSDGQSVYIERGAIVDGCISAENASNIRVFGRGVLDATKYGSATVFKSCRNVEISGITTVKGGKGWVNKIMLCDQVRFTNYKDIAWGAFSDGIDLLGSKNVTIEDVFIRNEDDSIVLKTSKAGVQGNVENILVQDAVIWHGSAGNAIEIGYETTGDFIRNVVYRNIDIIRADTHEPKFNRAAISMHLAGNAAVSNIRYENIRIEAAMEYLINFQLVNVKKWGNGGGSVSNVLLKDIFLTDGPDAPSIIRGLPSSALRGIVFENMNYKGVRINDSNSSAKHHFLIQNAKVVWR